MDIVQIIAGVRNKWAIAESTRTLFWALIGAVFVFVLEITLADRVRDAGSESRRRQRAHKMRTRNHVPTCVV